MLCKVERILYANQSSGFTVAALSTDDHTIPAEAISPFSSAQRLQFSATGYFIPDRRGVELEITGRWQKNKKYGLQMVIEYFTEVIPKTTAAIIGYLASGLVKGIGEKTAKAIVKQFGVDALDIMDTQIDRLLEVPGISHSKLEKIKDSYQQSRGLREIVAFLSPYGISANKAAKIQQEFKGRAMEILRSSPYELCAITGFGFLTVDRIARAIGLPADAPDRIRSALSYVMEQSAQQGGHLYLPKEDLFFQADQILNNNLEGGAVTDDAIKQQTNHLVQSKELIYEQGKLFIPKYYKAEHAIADTVVRCLVPANTIEHLESMIAQAEKDLGIILSESQCAAVKTCLQNQISILTGGPGTGKTTCLKVILHVYGLVFGGTTLLAAPTGRASRKMEESTGEPASTLDSALGLYRGADAGKWVFDDEPLDADFIIVDEGSMIDIWRGASLFSRLGTQTKLLMVGDPDQLPPVGAGNVFRDLIQCGVVPTVKLDTVFRQQQGSRIAINAQAICRGEPPTLYGPDFQFITADSDQEAAQAVCDLFLQLSSRNGVEEVQILSPFRSRGVASVSSLNDKLHDMVNRPMPDRPELRHGERIIRLGDKVMQLENRLEASNGDIGFVTDISLGQDNDSTLTVSYPGGRMVRYGTDDLTQLDLALAMTVHKSQGSEYKIVIMPLLKSQYTMLRRDLIYTGITRAKSSVILVGQKQALFMAIRRDGSSKRFTMLETRVLELYQKTASNGLPPLAQASATLNDASKPA